MFLNNRGEVKIDKDDDDSITIDDDDDDDDKNKVKDDDDDIILDDDDDTDAEEEKKRNHKFAEMRAENKKLNERLAALESAPPPVTAPIAAAAPVDDGIPKTEAEWDALADKDWKKAVDLRSTQNAQKLMKNHQQEARYEKVLEESKQKVIASHPELNDNSSEKTKIFTHILSQNPEYVNHPKGPIFAMRDMEDYMETVLGYKRKDIVSAEKQGARKESERQHRIVLNDGRGKTTKDSKGKITISKEDLEFCKLNDIDPKIYVKNRKKLSAKGAE